MEIAEVIHWKRYFFEGLIERGIMGEYKFWYYYRSFETTTNKRKTILITIQLLSYICFQKPLSRNQQANKSL